MTLPELERMAAMGLDFYAAAGHHHHHHHHHHHVGETNNSNCRAGKISSPPSSYSFFLLHFANCAFFCLRPSVRGGSCVCRTELKLALSTVHTQTQTLNPPAVARAKLYNGAGKASFAAAAMCSCCRCNYCNCLNCSHSLCCTFYLDVIAAAQVMC